jgi:hypothetical protein
MLDDERYGSVNELVMAEKLERGYLGRILMLALLAPDIRRGDHGQPATDGTRTARAAGWVSRRSEGTATTIRDQRPVAP